MSTPLEDRRAGLEHAHEAGFDRVCLEVDRVDDVLRAVLEERGFVIEENGLIESWLVAGDRPPISTVCEGYELVDRSRPSHPDERHRSAGRARARRIKICFEPDNPAAGHLYLSVGFEPDRENDISPARRAPETPGGHKVRKGVGRSGRPARARTTTVVICRPERNRTKN